MLNHISKTSINCILGTAGAVSIIQYGTFHLFQGKVSDEMAGLIQLVTGSVLLVGLLVNNWRRGHV